MIFTINGMKIAAMNGFELHFDNIWLEILKKKVDLVSKQRWSELIKARAFLNGAFILRANRIGEYTDKEISWKFYGESYLVYPNGEIHNILGSKEEMLIAYIDKNISKDVKRDWGFGAQIIKREKL